MTASFTLLALLLSKDAGGAAVLQHGRDRYQNPIDLDAYVAAQEDPARAAWQKPEQVLDTVGLRAGQVVCDIGAGPGYFALPAAKRVGPAGHVWAVDVDPRIVDALRTRIEKAGVRNVTPVLGLADDPLLPDGTCDVILLMDVYHHLPNGAAYLQRLVPLMRAGGRVINVDWHKRKTDIGLPQDHRVAREAFLSDAARAGLKVVAEPTFLPHQYFLILSRAPSR